MTQPATAPDQQSQNHLLQQENDHLRLQVAELHAQLGLMRRLIFGSKHERFVPLQPASPAQLSLDIQANEVAACTITSVTDVSYKKVQAEVKPVHPGRRELPAGLRREITLVSLEEIPEGYVVCGYEDTEQLELNPGDFWVSVTRREKIIKKDKRLPGPLTIVAPLPPRVMHKCIAANSLLSHIAVDKFVDHMPWDRERKRFQRYGMNFPYSTINGWMMQLMGNMEGLFELHKAEVLSSPVLQADETGIRVIDKQKKTKPGKSGKLHKGWYWLYQNNLDKTVIFDYRPDRSRAGPSEILRDYRGYVQTDGLGTYDLLLDINKDIKLSCCWVHARRYFERALDASPGNPVMEYPLKEMQRLFAIERDCKEQGLSYQEVQQARQQQALPVLSDLYNWLVDQRMKWGKVNKLPFVVALNYILNHWDKLCLYVTDGRLSISNNQIENSVRPVAVGRKGYLFAGSHEAAYKNGMMYSLFGTCKMHGINPQIWLKDVLDRLPAHPKETRWQLLPQHWTPQQIIEKATE